MTGNCGYREGEVHPHVDRCYRAGAVEALREAADVLLEIESVDWALAGREAGLDAARILRTRADLIASGKAVTS